MNAAAVEDTGLEFKSISCSAVNGADSLSFMRRQLCNSWFSDDAVNDGRTVEGIDSVEESASHDANSIQSDDEVHNCVT